MVVLLLLSLVRLTAPEIDAAATCLAAMQEPRMRDARRVAGVLTTCWQIARAGSRRGVPSEIVVAMGYYETRFQSHLRGRRGEIGTLQVNPRWWPEARQDPTRAAIGALLTMRAYAFKRYGRRAANGWGAALAHYNGGLEANWDYTAKVQGMAQRLRAHLHRRAR